MYGHVMSRSVQRRLAAQRGHTYEVHEAEEGGYWATCPEVPGANGQGGTENEAVADLEAAIRLLEVEEG